MMALFEFPRAAAFGRILPKNKIYEHAAVGSKVKRCFVEEVDQVKWAYKLAPETVNLTGTPSVPEIQVIEVKLRGAALNHEILQAIDRAIPFPSLFELIKPGERKLVAAYKRPSEVDTGKWVVSDYFESDWHPAGASRQALPHTLDLRGLYERLIKSLMPATSVQDEALPERVARIEAIRAKERDIARIKSRLAREKQFNKRIAINAELRVATKDLKQLDGNIKSDTVKEI